MFLKTSGTGNELIFNNTTPHWEIMLLIIGINIPVYSVSMLIFHGKGREKYEIYFSLNVNKYRSTVLRQFHTFQLQFTPYTSTKKDFNTTLVKTVDTFMQQFNRYVH